ncbi:MAG: DsbA family oxidoreductase [Desulfovibrio sp.]|nr:DsbA family oxidoreductase [Desulfovibrio sp.]
MKIDVWSDYACPFCQIGEIRLREAIKELGLEDQTEIIPRAFEINPDAPISTDVNGLATIARRYRLPEASVREQFERIAEMGLADGIVLNQIDTKHTNPFDARRLMKLGLSTGDKNLIEKLNNALFEAFFVDNLNLADKDVLLERGMKAGLKKEDIMDVLSSDKFGAETRADEYEDVRERGVSGVPYFIFENGATASGALEKEEFKNILLNVARDPGGSSGSRCGRDGCEI